MAATKLSYFETRAANNVWDSYNDTEKFQRELIGIYQQANREVLEELYKLGARITQGGQLSRSEFYRGNHLKKLSSEYTRVLNTLGETLEDKGTAVILGAGKEAYERLGELLDIPINYNKSGLIRLIQEPWKGVTFSDRVWNNQAKLHAALMGSVKDGIHKGRSVTEMALQLNKEMNSGLNNAARLVRTETMHHLNDANLQAMKDAGVKQIKEVVTLDERTSDQCAPHQGMVHDIDKAPGLPRHPNCRCTMVAHFDIDKIAAEYDSEEAAILASMHIDRMAGIESEVTQDLKNIASAIGGKMEGLEYRLKKVDRLGDKILTDSKEKGISLKDADAQINDALRYTLVFEENRYADGYFLAVDKLTELGYTKFRVKNTFKEGSPYKGINTLLKKNGEIFELQYHTPISLEIKEINHKLYEEQRIDSTLMERKLEIDRLMKENSKSIPQPKGVSRIK